MTRPVSSGFESLEPRRLFASATVNFNDVRQTIDGFGASSAWMSGTIPAAAAEQIFNTTTGAGFSLLRTRVQPVGGSSESDMALQAGKYGARVWSTPWTQPREWKSNHDTNNGGSLLAGHYQDYADHLANYVLDMKARGVPLYAISLQNEPNWTADYESTTWTAAQFAAFLPIVGQTFAQRGVTAKIILPESLNWNFSLASTVMADPNLAQYVGILAAHNYGESGNPYVPVSIAAGRPVWETEFYSHVTTSEIAKAIDTADDMHQALTDANAAAYHYWWLSSSGDGSLMSSTWQPSKRLWAMGQYSRFVRPGWVRVGSTDDGGGLDVSTFKDPASGKFAIVVVNTNTAGSVNETFNLSGLTAASVTPYVTSATDDLAAYAPVTLTNASSFTQTIAANSIVTYYGVSADAPTLQAPGSVRAAPVQGATSGQIAVSWADNSTSETGYVVERSTDGATWTVATSTLAANATGYVDSGRSENTTYVYRVKAVDAATSSAYGATATGATILLAPTGVTGTAVTGGVRLNWTISSAASTGVTVDRSLDGVTWTAVAALATRAATYTDTIPGYDTNQTYYYRVRNTAGVTRSPIAAWNSGVKTPTNFVASRVTGRSVTLTWTNTSIGASGAWIEQQTGTGTTWTRVSPTGLEAAPGTFQLNGLTPGTAYRFRLRTSGAADTVYSGYTGTVSVTTPVSNGQPVVWLKADETGGSTLADASGNANDATLTGSYGFVAGKSGNALRLTGGYAGLPNGVVGGLNDFTIAAWVNPSVVTSWARLFEIGTANTNTMYFTVRASDTNLPRFGITVNGGTSQRVDSSVALPANAWSHVAITLSGNTATMYVNGQVAGTNTAMTVRPAGLGTTTQNFIGKSVNSWDPLLTGSIDDFRIYDRGLSAGEMRALVTPAAVGPVTINGGAAQRSRVTDATVIFTAPVTPAAGAFSAVRRSDGQTFDATAVNANGDGLTFALTFTGPGTENGSLPDGVYDLTVRAALVRDLLGQTLAGGDYHQPTHRLFGDYTGDGTVGIGDFNFFATTFGTGRGTAGFDAAFDNNNDDVIGIGDFNAFAVRFGVTV